MPEKIPLVRLPGNVEIPVLGLGTWLLTGEKCIETVKLALQLGYRHIDTAEMYGNQREIGMAIQGFDRKKLFIVSKVWTNHLCYKDVLKACDETLRELNTRYLDLYLIHGPSTDVPVQETLKALDELKEQGKIRGLGVSNFNEAQLQEALSTGSVIATNQVEFHPLLYQKELLQFCSSKKVPITAYCPIARGRVLQNKTIQRIAEKHGKSPAQVSLKWLLHKGLIAIPKASSRQHLRENIDLFGWQLGNEELGEIDAIKEQLRLVQRFLSYVGRLGARSRFNA